jgi:hypothetical protein
METRDSEKERPDGGQGSGDAGDAPHGRPFDGNLKPQPALLLFTWARIGLGLLARQRPEKRPDHTVGDAVVSTQAMCQCGPAAALVHLPK